MSLWTWFVSDWLLVAVQIIGFFLFRLFCISRLYLHCACCLCNHILFCFFSVCCIILYNTLRLLVYRRYNLDLLHCSFFKKLSKNLLQLQNFAFFVKFRQKMRTFWHDCMSKLVTCSVSSAINVVLSILSNFLKVLYYEYRHSI